MESNYETKSVMVGDTMYDLRVKSVSSKNYDYQLALASIKDYRRIIDTPNFNLGDFEQALSATRIQISATCPPEDALSKHDMALLSDEELVSRVNTMANYPKKVLFMFAHGYGFRWDFMTDLMEYKGFCNVGAAQKPVYIIPDPKLEGHQGVISGEPPVPFEIHVSELLDKEYPKDIRNSLSVKAREDLDFLVPNQNNNHGGRVKAEILEHFLAIARKMKETGELKIYGIKEEKTRVEYLI